MGTQSALARARTQRGLTQAEVAEYTGVDVATVCRWEKGINQPYPRHVVKLCTLFERPACELGLPSLEQEDAPPSPVSALSAKESAAFANYFEHNLELRLHYILYDWLHDAKRSRSSCAQLQYRLSQELESHVTMKKESEQNHHGVDLPRRDALRRIALLPIYALSLDAVGSAPQWTPEEVLPHCAAGITACQQLSKGQSEDMSLAFSVLTTYLTPLREIVDQSSQHRKEASRLVAQALLIKTLLSLHREGPKRALTYCKQAEIYSRESADITLQLISLTSQAEMYAYDRQDQQALNTALKARSLLLKQQKQGIPVHPLIQSDIYGVEAKYQARNGQEEEAFTAIGDAKEAFFTPISSADDTSAAFADFNYSNLILRDGLTYYHLEQYEQALNVFAEAIDLTTLAANVPASSERVRVEIINYQTLTSLKSPKKEKEFSIRLWKAGMQGAIDLRSEQRFAEALTAYDIMQALWSGDKRVKELRALTRHW